MHAKTELLRHTSRRNFCFGSPRHAAIVNQIFTPAA
jgi:hypothetical protein